MILQKSARGVPGEGAAAGYCCCRGVRSYPSARVGAQYFQNPLLGLDVGGDRLISQSGGAHVRAGSLLGRGMAAELDDLAVDRDQSGAFERCA